MYIYVGVPVRFYKSLAIVPNDVHVLHTSYVSV